MLDVWDRAIEKTDALVKAKEKKFGWLLHELIGKRKANKNLSEVCDLETGLRIQNNKLFYLEIGDINIQTKDYEIEKKAKQPVSGAILVPKNTLLISTVRPTRGAVTKTKSEIYVSSAFCKIKLKNDFYFYCVQQEKFFNYLKDKQSGATYPTVKNQDILTFKVPLLSEEEQQQIAHILNTARSEINLLKKLATHYRTQKQGLMQKLLTGTWAVSV